MKIPITMSHGTDQIPGKRNPLTQEHFARLVAIAHELGFQSISYDDLAAWLWQDGSLPERPIMFDFDHPMKSMHHEVYAGAGPLRLYGKPLHQHRSDG